jgi:hypothetical protein
MTASRPSGDGRSDPQFRYEPPPKLFRGFGENRLIVPREIRKKRKMGRNKTHAGALGNLEQRTPGERKLQSARKLQTELDF